MERGNRYEARGDTRLIPVVPFLCKKVRLRLERCGGSGASERHNWPQLEMGGSMHTNATNASPQDAEEHHTTEHHEGLTLFSGNHRHEGLGYPSNIGDSFAAGISLYMVLGAHIHNSIGGSQAVTTQVISLSKR